MIFKIFRVSHRNTRKCLECLTQLLRQSHRQRRTGKCLPGVSQLTLLEVSLQLHGRGTTTFAWESSRRRVIREKSVESGGFYRHPHRSLRRAEGLKYINCSFETNFRVGSGISTGRNSIWPSCPPLRKILLRGTIVTELSTWMTISQMSNLLFSGDSSANTHVGNLWSFFGFFSPSELTFACHRFQRRDLVIIIHYLVFSSNGKGVSSGSSATECCSLAPDEYCYVKMRRGLTRFAMTFGVYYVILFVMRDIR